MMSRDMSRIVTLAYDIQHLVTNLQGGAFKQLYPEKRKELRRMKKEMMELVNRIPIMELTTRK